MGALFEGNAPNQLPLIYLMLNATSLTSLSALLLLDVTRIKQLFVAALPLVVQL